MAHLVSRHLHRLGLWVEWQSDRTWGCPHNTGAVWVALLLWDHEEGWVTQSESLQNSRRRCHLTQLSKRSQRQWGFKVKEMAKAQQWETAQWEWSDQHCWSANQDTWRGGRVAEAVNSGHTGRTLLSPKVPDVSLRVMGNKRETWIDFFCLYQRNNIQRGPVSKKLLLCPVDFSSDSLAETWGGPELVKL